MRLDEHVSKKSNVEIAEMRFDTRKTSNQQECPTVNWNVVLVGHFQPSGSSAPSRRSTRRTETTLQNLKRSCVELSVMRFDTRHTLTPNDIQTVRRRAHKTIGVAQRKEQNGGAFSHLFTMNNTAWKEQARLSGLVVLRNDDDNINHEHPQWKAPEWLEGRPVMIQNRYGHSHVVVRHPDNSQRETIVVLGGSEYYNEVNSVLLWNAENGNCCQGPSMVEARSSLTAVVCGDNIYAIGGYNSISKALNSIERISIHELLHSWTSIDCSASKTTTTLAWQPFHCCLSKPRADAKAVAVQDRYIVVAGGTSNAANRKASPTASVDIIDTHLPCLRCAFAGPRLNYPYPSFEMAIVQNRIFVIGSLSYDSAKQFERGGISVVDYLDFDPSWLDTTSRDMRSVELSSTSMSWKVHKDPTARGETVVRVGSCLLLCPWGTSKLLVFDTKRSISWEFPGTDPLELYSPSMVALTSGVVRFGISRLNGQDGVYCSRVGLVDKQSLFFKRLLDLSDLQIQSLVHGKSH